MKNILENIIKRFDSDPIDYTIFIIANTHNILIETEKWNYQHANMTEFFSKEEFAEISSAIFSVFGFVKVFYSEIEFIQFVLNNSIDKETTIVYNLSRDGIKEGKKSLIPSFCDLLGIKYTGSNAFVISLLRNKFTYSSYLNKFNIPVPNSYYYDKDLGFLLNKPTKGKKIIKHVNESASIGLSEDNIIELNELFDEQKLIALMKEMQTESLLIQDYISGSECEVFVINYNSSYYAFDPIEIKIIKSTIITSEISDTYDYEFDFLSNHYDVEICNMIRECAIKAAKLLNIQTYARFDFRVSNSGQFYLIDIAGTPYTIKHSSINYLFQKYGFNYQDIYKVIIQLSK